MQMNDFGTIHTSRTALLDNLREARAEGRTATTTQRSALPTTAERIQMAAERATLRARTGAAPTTRRRARG